VIATALFKTTSDPAQPSIAPAQPRIRRNSAATL